MFSDKYLLIDTTNTASSYALYTNNSIVGIKHQFEAQEQAAQINILIADLLQEANWQMNDLTAIGICSGPGSYTGMRIGYSVAKGICFGLSIPLLAINKFEVLAYKESEFPVLVGLKAREGEYFLGVKATTNEWSLVPQHATEDALLSIVREQQVSTAIFDVIPDRINEENHEVKVCHIAINTPLDMHVLGLLAEAKKDAGLQDDIAYSEPLYLKSVYTTTAKKKSIF